jgi:adenosylhomocysteine nucleosidase
MIRSTIRSMKPSVVILICADAEWQATLDLIPGAHLQSTPFGSWFTALLSPGQPVIPHNPGVEIPPGAIPVVCMQTGWGKIAAAGATQYAIQRWKPSLLVNLGTCGGFEGSIQRGEILLVDRTIVYDILEQMGDFDAHIDYYTTQLDMDWLSLPYPQDVRRTLLVSGDRDLLVDDIPWLKQRFGAVAGDWESGAIAFIARKNGTRLLILRGVTDLVGAEGGEAYGNLNLFRQESYRIMQQLFKSVYDWVRPGLD